MIECREKVVKKSIILFSALLIMASLAGCQKIKRIFVKPPPEGVVQESYAIPVYVYESSVKVKATPRELISRFIEDPTWIVNASSPIQAEILNIRTDMDSTEVGYSVDFNVQILGINFPCRIINFKYKPEKELWLMVMSGGTWLLARIETRAIPDGTLVTLNTIGKPSRTMGAILDTFQLAEATAGRVDNLLAFIQSEFDPDLDVKELTEKGLRGEVYEEFLQVNRASVWVDAEPGETARWIIANLDQSMPEIRVKGDCGTYKVFDELAEDEARHCPAEVEFVNVNLDINTFLTWRMDGKERIYKVYLQGIDRIGLMQLAISPETGGSRVECMVMTDIPGSGSSHLMDIMMAFVAMPKRVQSLLLDIKQGVERIG